MAVVDKGLLCFYFFKALLIRGLSADGKTVVQRVGAKDIMPQPVWHRRSPHHAVLLLSCGLSHRTPVYAKFF